MAAIFPPADRGGIPPGVNVVNGFSPSHPVIGDGPLYVSPDCSTVLTDGQLNAITSEVLAAVDELGFAFNTVRVDNLGQALSQTFDHVTGQLTDKVDRTGDTMAGPLLLTGDPSDPLEATTKAYVDDENDSQATALRNYVDNITTSINSANQAAIGDLDARKVNRSGDTMTGPLNMAGANSRLTLAVEPIGAMEATNKQYVDDHISQQGGFVEAPMDGLIYGRGRRSWIRAVGVDEVEGLTADQQSNVRQAIYAAPYDALASTGLQLNGAMEVSQEWADTTITINDGTDGFVLDCWKVHAHGVSAISQQVLDAPPGFRRSLRVAVTAPTASPAVSNYLAIGQDIEGLRVARCAFGTSVASPVTIGFWMKANRPGSYTVSLRTAAGTRSYLAPFSIDTPGLWQFVALTIPGDVIGTWPNDTTMGWQLWLIMMAGANFQSSANAWLAGNFLAATGSTNGAAATTDYINLTGFFVVPGVILPPPERSVLLVRPDAEELQRCMRYYEQGTFGVGAVTNPGITTNYHQSYSMPKRIKPNLHNYSVTTTGQVGSWSIYADENVTTFTVQVVGSTAGAFIMGGIYAADARL